MSNEEITQEKLKKILYYNPTTGTFTWITSRPGARKSLVAGCLCKKSGYRFIGIDYKVYKSSRLAYLYMNGKLPIEEIDHKNRIRHDDRWCNLRKLTTQKNAMNRKILLTNSSGVTGVCWIKKLKKYQAMIGVDNKNIFLGYFNNRIDAIIARYNGELKYGFAEVNRKSSSYIELKNLGLI